MQTATLPPNSWECIHFSLEHDPPTFDFGDYYIGVVDAAIANSKEELLNSVASVFHFPYFGKNWDALQDALQDLEWLPAPGYVLTIRNASMFWQSSRKFRRPKCGNLKRCMRLPHFSVHFVPM